jgi:hypothetical protein
MTHAPGIRSSARRACFACVLAATLLGIASSDLSSAAEAQAEIIEATGGRIRLTLADSELAPARDRLRTWTARSADIVARYYGRFPMDETNVIVESRSGSGVGHGVSFREQEGLINVTVGSAVTEAELRDDWVLIHEMIHLALPNVRRRHLWLSEGISTYVEGVARVQAGQRPAEDVWFELMRAMPQGLPRTGDEGLDNTHTWGRTYWGGAAFCLLADVKIRERTNGRKGLQDALAAVAVASRGDAELWPIETVLRVGDEAIGVSALADLYAEMKDKPVSPDLDALWSSLGVMREGASVRFDDEAPRAAIRRRIMAPPRAPAG